ncbi:Clan CA, family C1, cathepsin L-like cysteine peptidase [Trichomonas vaginalis G3]|uniref:Clan CA, family C1, cathepsin L-like cysteine peptidase n=1 Tax=Trichomonas vaginalis (strain ATCC PRA-98 / G3) TaxID=412133 RepID=A2EZN7_TRIV3|nr:cysteine-type peptidase protein [Trichomonas vaginalis G3]EAY01875.1 Clan CA, family C1, cathepsin L-like cysteine peptidase [Trichomonas vaginalis G3]KAI5549674.1 cysteine-type peptidase protein [Trichomonas vaginalis G3]|eukprot:XP_001314419.1 Clan CA, family C1, cathepsin L-like cysteine peptidase [Trichomonas vaginalis G3]
MFSAFFATASSKLFLQHEEKAFLDWMRSTNNMFVGDEYHFRLGVYNTNKRRVQEHNRANSGYQLTMNHLSCMTPSEYKVLLGHKQTKKIEGEAKIFKGDVPDAVDWRNAKIVNPIKDQAQCGSCWAFSVVQAQESQWALKKGQLLSLAEQNMVDCVDTCYGCDGGDEYLAYDYVIKHQKGLWMLETDYPYTARDGSCKFKAAKGVTLTKSYVRPTTTQNEDELKAGCAKGGVVSIAIDASGYDFQLYSSGIYNPKSCSSTFLDHAVGLVGYGTENKVDYWIVRNSWGTSWGEKGYIRMIRNNGNKCGVATDVIIPQVE